MRTCDLVSHAERTGERSHDETRRAFGYIRRLPSKRYQARYTGPDLVRHAAPDTFDAEAWLAEERRIVASEEWVPTKARAAGRGDIDLDQRVIMVRRGVSRVAGEKPIIGSPKSTAGGSDVIPHDAVGQQSVRISAHRNQAERSNGTRRCIRGG